MPNYDPQILISAAITMQRIAQAISQHGYRYWIGGSVSADKAMSLVAKMDARYGLSLSTPQRYRAAMAGRSVALMRLYPEADATTLRWIIMRRKGALPANDSEQWQDAHHHRGRIEWGGYELIRLPYTRAQRDAYAARSLAIDKANSWTWRMTQSTYQGHERRIRSGVAALKKTGSTARLDQALYSLARAPGFRRVRDQVFALRRYAGEQLRRARLPPKDWGAMPLYMRLRSCRTYPLSTLVTRVGRGEANWFPLEFRGRQGSAETPIRHVGTS